MPTVIVLLMWMIRLSLCVTTASCFKVPSVDDTSQEDYLKYFLASYCALNSNSKNVHASFEVCWQQTFVESMCKFITQPLMIFWYAKHIFSAEHQSETTTKKNPQTTFWRCKLQPILTMNSLNIGFWIVPQSKDFVFFHWVWVGTFNSISKIYLTLIGLDFKCDIRRIQHITVVNCHTRSPVFLLICHRLK